MADIFSDPVHEFADTSENGELVSAGATCACSPADHTIKNKLVPPDLVFTHERAARVTKTTADRTLPAITTANLMKT